MAVCRECSVPNMFLGILTKTAFERKLNDQGFPPEENRKLLTSNNNAKVATNYGSWLRKFYPEEFEAMWIEACKAHDDGRSYKLISRMGVRGNDNAKS
jgi:hypothetical protein